VDVEGESQFEGAHGISDGIDNVVADDGEGLDEAIWNEEGYDALYCTKLIDSSVTCHTGPKMMKSFRL
jgi:hypothetical protein